jgi:hypothetical protein
MSSKTGVGAHSDRVAKGGQTEAQAAAAELLRVYSGTVEVLKVGSPINDLTHRDRLALLQGMVDGNITVGNSELKGLIEYLDDKKKFNGVRDNLEETEGAIYNAIRTGLTTNGNPLGGRALARDVGSPA